MFEFSVKRPVAVSVIMISIVILGIFFGSNLNLELIPTLDIPVAAIITTYQGAGPTEVEEQISKKIEDQVGSVENLKKVTSTSQDDVSIVIAEFYYGTDMIQALSDVRDKVEIAKRNLPDEADNPTIYKVDPNSRPIVVLAMKAGNMDLRTLRDRADDDIKKEFEKIPGVASVTVSGGYEREIAVLVDPGKLQQFNISPSKVITAIQKENINVPAGNILTKDQKIQIRSMGQFTRVDDLNDVYVAKSGGRRIFISDIAEVKDTNKEQTSITRVNDSPCVTIEIIRNNDANIATVCDRVKAKAEQLNKSLPEGCELVPVKDDSDMIRKSLHAMIETAIEAMVLAIIVIFIFLANFRSTLIVSLSIPVSIFATFTTMHFGDFSLNIVTMSAFTLAIGRVIDDSIVVLENIFRYMENGVDPKTAAVEATKEVGLAILASTLTTMSVFLPLLLLKGIVGQYFIPLAMTFMSAMFISLLSAILLVPMLCARVLKIENMTKKKTGIKVITVWFNEFFKKVELFYRNTLNASISHKWVTLFIALALFVVSLIIFGSSSVAFQPQIDNGVLSVTIETPVGTSLDKTDEVMKRIEKIGQDNFGEVTKYLTAISGSSGGSGGNANESTAGTLMFRFIDKKDRPGKTAMAMRAKIRDELKDIPGLIYTTSINQGGRQTSDIEIILKGDDLDKLAELGTYYKQKFAENVKGAAELDLGWKKGKPEYRIIVDKKKAGQYGINMYDIGTIVMTNVMGTQVADVNKYKENDKDYDITVQLDRENRDTKEKIEQIPIRINDDINVPLCYIAEVIPDEAPSKITRDSRERSISIKGSAAAGYENNDVLKGMINYIKNVEPLPDGYSWRVGGEEEDRSDAFRDLISSLVLAIFIVYVILAIQFESFIHPFTIMMAVPLELIGVSIALMVTGEPVSMVVMLGVILLTGIVVSNSILLINYILVLREKGIERKEAILQAGPIRLRPIVMTAIATCIAMIPLALGMREGAEFFSGLGKVVIGGLISSTFLTLLVVPCVYIVMDDISNFLSGKGKKKNDAKAETAEAK